MSVERQTSPSKFRLKDPAAIARRKERLAMLRIARRNAERITIDGRKWRLLRLPDSYGDEL
jgi:hypothetical protein